MTGADSAAFGAAGPGTAAADLAPGFGVAGAAFFSGAGEPAPGGGFSLILRTTGASIVELALLTNSPCSLR